MSQAFWKPVYRLKRSLRRTREADRWRASWQQTLRASELPLPVQGLIAQVIKGSRLWSYEKHQVTEELIAHFQDGHQHGNSYENLTASFGDPQVTAQLIRNSKLRSRPMYAKVLKVVGFGGLGALIAYLAALAFFYSGQPNPSTDYIARLNTPLASIPEQDRAWEIYRDAWTRFEFCEGPGGRLEELYVRTEDDREVRLVRPDDAGWLAAIDRLQRVEELLEALREGGRRPRLGLPLQAQRKKYSPQDQLALFPGWDAADEDQESGLGLQGLSEETEQLMSDSMVGILLPHTQSLRNAARILYVDTRWALQQGDTQRAVENLEAIFGFAQQSAEHEFLVCSLVGFAICTLGYDLIDEVLATDPDVFSETDLARVRKAVESNNIRDFVSFQGERMSIDDMIQRIYTDNGSGDGRITPQGLEVLDHYSDLVGMWPKVEPGLLEGIFRSRVIGGPVSLFLLASRQQLTERVDQIMAIVEQRFDIPFWEERDALSEIDTLLQEEPLKYRMLLEMMPAYEAVRHATERLLANQQGMILALAAHQYRLQQGHWPASIHAMMPDWLAQVPLDRVTGKPLGFRNANAGIIVYSVGLDEDDDGGRPLLIHADGSVALEGTGEVPEPASAFTFRATPRDGDWVIWPRHSRQ